MDDRGTQNRSQGSQAGQTQRPTDNNQSLGDTVTGIVEDLQSIVRGEVQLAKTELKEDASKAGKAIAMIASGALLGMVGLIFLMLGVTFLLNEWIEEMWISAGIVALALLVIAGIVAMVGKNKLTDPSLGPDQTIASVKEDKQWANQQIKSVRK